MKKKRLGDTEATVLVGAGILGGWLLLDVFIKRTERKDLARQQRSAAKRAQPASRMATPRTRRRGA